MKNVLMTGSTGFIGRNVIPFLESVSNVYTPSRNELNLLDECAVKGYIVAHKINIVIHAANPNPVKNSLDKTERMFEESIRMFMNLYRAERFYDKMYTLGSGAEYDKSMDISLISEEEEMRSVPYDSYGLAKFTINNIIHNSSKQCNLRIFACYGPGDHYSKFITHCINCCINELPITINQNCYFDYMHVEDLGEILKYFIFKEPKHKSYNVCSGTRVSLEEIANIVKNLMRSKSEIVFLKSGLNNEYTGNNKRLLEELQGYTFITLEEGIKKQIVYETLNRQGV